jgi:hypothetical protein
MFTQQAEIRKALAIAGWEIARPADVMLEWWADEIWVLKSTWSPAGFNAYLTFLVDPHHDEHRKPGQAVWAVGVCRSLPEDRFQAEGPPCLFLGRGWKGRLLGFVREVGSLRNSAD